MWTGSDCVLQNVMERINMKKFFRSQPVLVISFLAAVLTVFIIPPDKEYIGYINKTVLIELFSLMTAVGGLRSVGIFDNATSFLLKKAGTLRRLVRRALRPAFPRRPPPPSERQTTQAPTPCSRRLAMCATGSPSSIEPPIPARRGRVPGSDASSYLLPNSPPI